MTDTKMEECTMKRNIWGKIAQTLIVSLCFVAYIFLVLNVLLSGFDVRLHVLAT